MILILLSSLCQTLPTAEEDDGLKLEEAKLGSAFLIMSIVGGAVLTKLQGGMITDYGVRTSFWLPAACFIMIALYGLRCYLTHDKSLSDAAA